MYFALESDSRRKENCIAPSLDRTRISRGRDREEEEESDRRSIDRSFLAGPPSPSSLSSIPAEGGNGDVATHQPSQKNEETEGKP